VGKPLFGLAPRPPSTAQALTGVLRIASHLPSDAIFPPSPKSTRYFAPAHALALVIPMFDNLQSTIYNLQSTIYNLQPTTSSRPGHLRNPLARRSPSGRIAFFQSPSPPAPADSTRLNTARLEGKLSAGCIRLSFRQRKELLPQYHCRPAFE
jgi:hypothetical protein